VRLGPILGIETELDLEPAVEERYDCHHPRVDGLRHVLEGEFMANDAKDESVLGHIDGLVKEEERLYSQGELPNLQTSHYVFVKTSQNVRKQSKDCRQCRDEVLIVGATSE